MSHCNAYSVWSLWTDPLWPVIWPFLAPNHSPHALLVTTRISENVFLSLFQAGGQIPIPCAKLLDS